MKVLYQVKVNMNQEFSNDISTFRKYENEDFIKKYTYDNFNGSLSENYSLMVGEIVQFLKEHNRMFVVRNSFEEEVKIEMIDNKISLVKYFRDGISSGEIYISCTIETICGNYLE